MAFALVGLSSVAACGSSSSSAGAASKPMTQISFGLADYVSEFGPYLVAQEKGYYAKEGLSLKFVQIAGSASISALEQGSLQFAAAAGSAVPGILKGTPIKVVSINVDSPPYLLAAKSPISSFSGLEGKKLGIQTTGDTIQIALNELLKQHNVAPSSVAEVPVGYAPNNLTALQNGAVPASFVESADLPELGPDFNLIGTTLGHVLLPIAGTAVSSSFLQSHQSEVEKFLIATAMGEKYYLNNPAYGIATLEKYGHESKTEATADYDYSGTWPLDGSASMSVQISAITQFAAANNVQLHSPAKTLASEVYDFSLAKTAYQKVFGSRTTGSIVKQKLPAGWKV